jgi:hypothetical protein
MNTFLIVWLTGAAAMFLYSLVRMVIKPDAMRLACEKNDAPYNFPFVAAVLIFGSLTWPGYVGNELAKSIKK